MLLLLGGLCLARGTWKCRCGCPGALAVRGEMGRDSSRGDIVLSWGLVGVRVEVVAGDTLPGAEQVSCLSSLCCLLFLSWGVRERKAALSKCRAGSPAKGMSLKEELGSSRTGRMDLSG